MVFGKRLLIAAYKDVSKITILKFGVFFDGASTLDKLDPKIEHVDLECGKSKTFHRRLVVDEESDDAFALWWSNHQTMGGDQVFPWAPDLREESRANVLLFYAPLTAKTCRVGYLKTPNEPLAVRFRGRNTLHLIGQESTSRGFVLESGLLAASPDDLQLRRIRGKSCKIALSSPISCVEFVSDGSLVFGCNDGSLSVFDCDSESVGRSIAASFAAKAIAVHNDEAVLIIVGERGSMQCFDVALNPLAFHFDGASSVVLDLSRYFRAQMSVKSAQMKRNAFCVRFHAGPIIVGKLASGVLNSVSALGPSQICASHLRDCRFREAILLIGRLDWASKAQTVLYCLSTTFNKLLRTTPYSAETETLLEMCLGLFYVPAKPIPEDIGEEFSEQIHDLSRKFFHYLLRHERQVKAFQLAVDIDDYDLFMDVYHSANARNMPDLASAALIKAKSAFLKEQDEMDAEPTTEVRRAEEELPMPMQLFSVAVDSPERPATPPKKEDESHREPQQAKYDSIVSLPHLTHLADLADDDIKVVHFGVV